MIQPTIEKLHAMRLKAMADALQAQLANHDFAALPFEERYPSDGHRLELRGKKLEVCEGRHRAIANLW